MATKKQRREAALAKHEAFVAEQKRLGLEAQRKDQERRAAQLARAEEEAEERNRKMNARITTLLAVNQMMREPVEIEDNASLEMECM